eukprot:344421-Alexandrium_andersonii.AAC.1
MLGTGVLTPRSISSGTATPSIASTASGATATPSIASTASTASTINTPQPKAHADLNATPLKD